MEVDFAHYIRVRYLPVTNTSPARYVVTWSGWPAYNGPAVRRRLIADDFETIRETAEAAAGLFVDWLNASGLPAVRLRVGRVIVGAAFGADWAVLVQTEEEPQKG